MKVVKATAQVLNTLWQYRDLRTIYKKVRTLGLTTASFCLCTINELPMFFIALRGSLTARTTLLNICYML